MVPDPHLNRALRTTGRDSGPYLLRPGPPGSTDPAVARSRQRPHGRQRPPSWKRTFTFEFTQASSKCPVYYLSWAPRPPLHSQRSQSRAQTEEKSQILPAKPIFHMPSSPGELPSPGTQVRPRFPVTSGWALFSQANQDQFAKLLASGLLGDLGGTDPPGLTCAPSERLQGTPCSSHRSLQSYHFPPHLQGC